jgi:hypothetical protein
MYEVKLQMTNSRIILKPLFYIFLQHLIFWIHVSLSRKQPIIFSLSTANEKEKHLFSLIFIFNQVMLS